MTKMIVSDLDNTLLLPDGSLGVYTVSTLKKCRQQNILVVFATARPFRTTARIRTAFMPDYVIANNGADIYKGEDLIRQHIIDPETVGQIIRIAKQDAVTSCIAIDDGIHQYTDYAGETPWNGENWNFVHTTFDEPTYKDITKVTIESADMQKIEETIDAMRGVHLYNNSGDRWCQIMHINATKLNGILDICTKEGIEIGDVIAFGDDFNDVQMLEACGKGVAVQNAAEVAKDAADEICMSNEREGVAKWLSACVYKDMR